MMPDAEFLFWACHMLGFALICLVTYSIIVTRRAAEYRQAAASVRDMWLQSEAPSDCTGYRVLRKLPDDAEEVRHLLADWWASADIVARRDVLAYIFDTLEL